MATLRAIVGGALAGLAPGEFGPLLLIPALSLLWSVADRSRLSALWGLVAVLVSHRWLLALHPLTWMGVPEPLSLPIALMIWLVCGGCGALLLALWSALARRLRFRCSGARADLSTLLGVVTLSLVWGLAEVVLSSSPLFWIGVGGTLLPFDPAWAALGRWVGAGGLAALQLLFSAWLWVLLKGPRPWRSAVFWALSLLAIHGIGAALLINPPPGQGTLSLAAWQPVVPTREKFSADRQQRLPAAVRKAIDQAEALEVAALVAPEGMLPSTWPGAFPDQQLPLISGGFRWDKGQQRSSLLLINGEAPRARPLLDKHRLVPLGESSPPLPAGLTAGLSAVGGLQPGEASRLMQGFTPAGAAAICYEISDGRALADAVDSGASWLLTIANLDPYPPLLQRQFLALAQLRAIETGRDLLSVANTGPTATVGADGRVNLLVAPGRVGIARAELQLRDGATVYSRLGDVPLILLLATALLGVVWQLGRPRIES